MEKVDRIREKDFEIPREYEPIDEYVVCSNIVKETEFLIDDKGLPPILLGKSEEEEPRIWMYTRDNQSRIIPVIEDNIAKYELAKLDHYDRENIIVVKIVGRKSEQVVLKVDYSKMIHIMEIDLRPLGYEIVGDEESLRMGNTTVSNSEFSGLKSVMSLK